MFINLSVQFYSTDIVEKQGVCTLLYMGGKGSQDPAHLETLPQNWPCWGFHPAATEADGGPAQERELMYHRGKNALT